MNNLYELKEPIIHPVNDQDIPTNLAIMPRIYRLTTIEHETVDGKCTRSRATLYHDKAALNVSWTTSSPDLRLKSGVLVSPRWFTTTTCENGAIRINRLVMIERPEPWMNLFHTVPYGWARERELVKFAVELVEDLPRPYRHLFNAIFWDGLRFMRFCTQPSSMNGHHSMDNGNLLHSVDVAGKMKEYCEVEDPDKVPMAVLAGLLHDAGKADEYRLSPKGEWKLSDRGKLLGHKVTVIEWVAQAKAKWNLLMPDDHYMALLHCLTCSPNAPDWLGIRKPAMLEAVLLSNMDRLSGTKDLMQRCTTNQNGWGSYHAHLNGQPYRIDGHIHLPDERDGNGKH